MNQKFVIVATLVVGLLTIATTNINMNVQASQGFFGKLGEQLGESLENLGEDIDTASVDYKQGLAAGTHAGVNGLSNDCPLDNTVYCVGWNIGYNNGAHSAATVNQNKERVIGDDNN